MLFQKGYYRQVGLTIGLKRPVLELHERPDQEFRAFQCVQPVGKFGQVLFVYRLADLGRSDFQADFDNSRVVAVVA